MLYMDFSSESSRNSPTIKSLLRSRQATLETAGGSHLSTQPIPGAISVPAPILSRGNISQKSTTQSGPTPGLPSSNTPQTPISAGSTVTTAPTPSNRMFFELCVNSGKYLKTLGEIDVSSINTDGEFFSAVKAHYLRLRSFRSRFWLLKPVNVSYVRVSHLFNSYPYIKSELNTRNSFQSKTVAG